LRVLPRLLQRRLEARGTAGATTLLGDQQRSDWLLTLAIDELHHDATAAPGQARLAVTAELFQRRTRRRVARQTFEQAVPLARADAAAAVDGLSAALTRTLDALLPWLEDTLARAARG
jgi:cholesterol transport system auxiliary component